MRPAIEELPDAGPEIEAAIMAVLIEYNLEAAGAHNYERLALVIRNEAGGVAGGLWAEAYYDWCFVRLLAVPRAARGQGVGRQLMQRAEAFARARGDDGVWLDTFSFQARGFYEKLGYRCFGQLLGHPRGGGRFFMEKRLGC